VRILGSLALLLPLAAFAAAPLPALPGSTLIGNVFAQPWAASDFTLTDQHGAPFHMADTKGKVVILTYIYTHCTDFCPFVALKLKETGKLLGADAGKFVLVAVTTDPERDTPRVCAAYSKAIGMFDSWRFVTGPFAKVRSVWKDYYIGVEREPVQPAVATRPPSPQEEKAAQEEAAAVARGLGSEDKVLVGRIIEAFGGGYDVSHDIPFWIVDKKGMMRVSLEADATPQDIASDVKTLIAE
jgi:cytochrome oxidase Cu insertion factor (SCO1/SenC/PrrC family)